MDLTQLVLEVDYSNQLEVTGPMARGGRRMVRAPASKKPDAPPGQGKDKPRPPIGKPPTTPGGPPAPPSPPPGSVTAPTVALATLDRIPPQARYLRLTRSPWRTG